MRVRVIEGIKSTFAQYSFHEQIPIVYFSCLLPPGHKIGTPEPLVKELKSEDAAALKKKYEGKAKSKSPPKEQVTGCLDSVKGMIMIFNRV